MNYDRTYYFKPDVYAEAYCPVAEDFIMTRNGFCACCGSTDHEEVDGSRSTD